MQKELKKLTITKVYAKDTKNDGSKLINKWGKPYWRVGIKTNEFGDRWLNGFLSYNPQDWVGQTKELEVWEEEYQGQKQLKFGLYTFKLTEEMWKGLLERVAKLEFERLPNSKPEIDIPDEYPQDNNNPEDIPF